MSVSKNKFLFFLLIDFAISSYLLIFPPTTYIFPFSFWPWGAQYIYVLPLFYFGIIILAAGLFLGKKIIFISKITIPVLILVFISQFYLIALFYAFVHSRCFVDAGSYERRWFSESKLCFQTEVSPDDSPSREFELPPGGGIPAPPSSDPSGNPLGVIPTPDRSLFEKRYYKSFERYGIVIPVPSRLVALSAYFLLLTVSFVLIRVDKRTK